MQNSAQEQGNPFKDVAFLFLCGVGLWSGFGFYTPIFYVPGMMYYHGSILTQWLRILNCTDYATNNLRLTPVDGATSAAMISGFSAFGRVVSLFSRDQEIKC
jgi:hypothetical protein